MPVLLPFKAYRPPRDKAHLVASRSYISYSREELEEKLQGNPYTFLHIINPEASSGQSVSKSTSGRFEMVADKFYEWVGNGFFLRDSQEGYYIYRQQQPNRTFTGIIGCTSVKDYVDGKIKIHEQTLTDREELFKIYLDKTSFHAEPVLLSYPDIPELNALVDEQCKRIADFDFSTTDRIRHSLWYVEEKSAVIAIRSCFDRIDAFYIADGHHRCASSLRLSDLRKAEEGDVEENAASNFFMSCLIPETQLHIEPFHRLVKDLGQLTAEDFLEQLKDHFEVIPVEDAAEARPAAKHSFGMLLKSGWYRLDLKNKALDSKDPIATLDTHIFTEKVLSPLLGISDLKTDSRISCIGGHEGATSIEHAVASGKYAAGFWLFPVEVDEIKAIADHNLIMPPKSTWVEPKLRSGLTVFTFEKGALLEDPLS